MQSGLGHGGRGRLNIYYRVDSVMCGHMKAKAINAPPHPLCCRLLCAAKRIVQEFLKGGPEAGIWTTTSSVLHASHAASDPMIDRAPDEMYCLMSEDFKQKSLVVDRRKERVR